MVSGQAMAPSISDHMNGLNRRTLEQQNSMSDILRRIEAIERYLGVSFSQPQNPCDVAPLSFPQ